MDSLGDYGASSSEDEEKIVSHPVKTGPSFDINSAKKRMKLSLAPVVASRETTLTVNRIIDPSSKVVKYNPKVEELFNPTVGPQNPFKTRQELAHKNTITGFVESANINDFSFEEQRRTFQTLGYAYDPAQSQRVIGDVELNKEKKDMTVFDNKLKPRNKDKRKKEARGDVTDLDSFKGPWRKFADEKTSAQPTEEEQELLDEWAEKADANPQAGSKKSKKDQPEKSIIHIRDTEDYQGKSFIEIPKNVGTTRLDDPEAVPDRCFLPKKSIHSWTGHTKGVAVIRLFPVSGHLLLSGGMDCKVKLWEYYGKRRCIRTYIGHTEAIKDIAFNNDGSRFLSCSFDKFIKLWNTESGECLRKFTTGKVPHCLRFNPAPDKQNMFIAGMRDKKIMQWDTETGEVKQEYDRHLGAVNSVTFVEGGSRFVSTSDDQSIRIWEWEIPVDFKYIAEPDMHSQPSVTIHPNGKYMCMQSMDNIINVYQAFGKFRQHRKKSFKGHMSSGYACQVGFSPDGNYVISGDQEGKLFIWDWKSGKMYKKLDVHTQVCIGAIWHPHEPSQVVTCSWDGSIKLWD